VPSPNILIEAPKQNGKALTIKRTHKLADGRDLFYFDDVDSQLPAERAQDTRELDPRPDVAHMRLDVLTGEWISVAASRHNRAYLPPAHECPLCPSTSTFASEIPDNFDVAVFENKNPAFGPVLLDNDDASYTIAPTLPLGKELDSVGRCEVVVFSPKHEGSMSSQSLERVGTILDALTDRTEHLLSLPGVRTVFPFENRGEEIGVTLHHPHGQIYAYPYVTPTFARTLESIQAHGASLFQDVLEFERSSERVLIAGDNFTAYVPFAARWPIEAAILPHRHVRNFVELNDTEREELASVYSRVLKAVDNLYETPTPYIAGWHQAPEVAGGENVRLQFKLTSPRRAADKLKFLAGSESAMGAFIADFPPEKTAAALRAAL
jgi:UDPglucose--hexose-1-phosphate uridylyltransferase